MRNLFLLLSSVLILSACNPPVIESGEQEASIPKPPIDENGFDEELAAKLGADDYGMHQYVIAFLKTGPTPEKDSLKAAQLQEAHMANIGRLAEEGTLALAGPFLGDPSLRGLYVFDVKTVEEAQALTASDPMIQSGHLVMELYPWYGSAAVMGINEVHQKISKIKM